MAEDAHIQFVDGLRVNADHLNNLQDRLHDAVVDLRRTVGLGRIAWGLRATVTDGKVGVDPGLAFAPQRGASGYRVSRGLAGSGLRRTIPGSDARVEQRDKFDRVADHDCRN